MQNKQGLPCDPAAERALFGSVFLDNKLYYSLSKEISADDFYDRRNRELWVVAGICIERGTFDLVTVQALLQERKTLDMVGGIEYAVRAINETPTSYGAHEYAAIVADRGKRRRLLMGYETARQSLMDVSSDISQINAYVQQAILAPERENTKTYGYLEAFDLFAKHYKKQEERGAEMPGIPTGYKKLDVALGGLEDAKMYVIGGRPAMGKTALALNMVYHMAKNGNPVVYFSLEMQVVEVMKRLISIATGISGQRIKSAKLDNGEKKRLKEFRKEIDSDNLIINDKSYQTIQSIQAECIGINTDLQAKGKRIRCIVIDHMQLLSSQMKSADRRVQVGEISRACKILADTMHCPVVILSQLSRALKNREDNRPILTDLRESGDIEQDADGVLFIHREGYYDPEHISQSMAEIIIAKNRDGRVGRIDFEWIPECTRFIEGYHDVDFPNEWREEFGVRRD